MKIKHKTYSTRLTDEKLEKQLLFSGFNQHTSIPLSVKNGRNVLWNRKIFPGLLNETTIALYNIITDNSWCFVMAEQCNKRIRYYNFIQTWRNRGTLFYPNPLVVEQANRTNPQTRPRDFAAVHRFLKCFFFVYCKLLLYIFSKLI